MAAGFNTTRPSRSYVSESSTTNGYPAMERFSLPGTGTKEVVEIGMYSRVTSGTAYFHMAIFTDSGDGVHPSTIVDNSDTGECSFTDTSHTVHYYTYSTRPQLNAGVYYWIGVSPNAAGTHIISKDTGHARYISKAYPGFGVESDWHLSSDWGYAIDLYAVYQDPASGLSIPLIQSIYRRRR